MIDHFHSVLWGKDPADVKGMYFVKRTDDGSRIYHREIELYSAFGCILESETDYYADETGFFMKVYHVAPMHKNKIFPNLIKDFGQYTSQKEGAYEWVNPKSVCRLVFMDTGELNPIIMVAIFRRNQ